MITLQSSLLGLLKFADNQFARWDAAQMLFTQELRRNVAHFQQGEAFEISPDVLTALAHVLENYEQDIELATLILTLPKDIEFAESLKRLIQMALQPQENYVGANCRILERRFIAYLHPYSS